MKDRPEDGAPSSFRRRRLLLGAAAEAADGAPLEPPGGADEPEKSGKKRILLIRHGCTHMNEYLSRPGCKWGDPGFTDVFPSSPEYSSLYRDTPLSPRGIRQAQRLNARLGHLLQGRKEGRPAEDVDMGLDEEHQDVLAELELVAVSPLTRALQTVEVGLLDHLDPAPVPGGASDGSVASSEAGSDRRGGGGVPIVALPLASERVYLISDLGDPGGAASLSRRFPYVDFGSELRPYHPHGDEWWFTLKDGGDGASGEMEGSGRGFSPLPSLGRLDYEEWRPSSRGQTYAHPGEPDDYFRSRMVALYDWLDSRPERTIAVVCHWGVLQWLSGHDFENCEMKVVAFDDMRREGLAPGTEEEEERLKKVDRRSEEEERDREGR